MLLNRKIDGREISRVGSRLGFNFGQLIAALYLIIVGVILIPYSVSVGATGSILFFAFAILFGLKACWGTQKSIDDPKLNRIGYIWLAKITVTLFLLYYGWIPDLDKSLKDFDWVGYDPQRFYRQAFELINNNWVTKQSLNYQGILYYYGAIFYVLGHNPVNPAVFNSLITLLASLVLIKFGYEVKTQRGPRDWTLALILLVPELLWYDVMTSRETLLASTLSVALISASKYMVGQKSISTLRAIAVIGLALFVIGAVRTSMVLPVVVGIWLMGVFVKSDKQMNMLKKTLVLGFTIVLLVAGPIIQSFIGGYEFDYYKAVERSTSVDAQFVGGKGGWTRNSIGLLLIPHSVFQSIAFVSPRLVAYIVAPFPNVFVSYTDLVAGRWDAWQHLTTVLSSMIYIILMPYAIAAFVKAVRGRAGNKQALALHIANWVVLFAIAGGNIGIHERYRVMGMLLFLCCAWLGLTTCKRAQVTIYAFIWGWGLCLGATYYVVYKGLI